MTGLDSVRALRRLAPAALLAGALGLAACQTAGGSGGAAAGAAGGAAAEGPPCGDRPIAEAVAGAGRCLMAATFGAETAGADPTLVVILHGDLSRGGAADYHVPIAREIGERPGVIAVALVRPGYPDGRGGVSQGSHSGRRDHYTAENNAIVADALRTLTAAHGASRTVVIGHSGGAAQTGAIIGRFPEVADAAMLVSCPCDVRKWRRMGNRSAWRRSQSPIEFADGVAADMRLVALTGGSDGNTRPILAEEYVAALTARGVDARFVLIPERGHGFNGLWPTVRRELTALLDAPTS